MCDGWEGLISEPEEEEWDNVVGICSECNGSMRLELAGVWSTLYCDCPNYEESPVDPTEELDFND